MIERQRPHPTGNTALNFEDEIAYVEKVQFIAELRKAGNIDGIIEIVGKRFADLQSRLAAKEAEIGAAFQKAALEARQLVHHAYRSETNSSVVEQLVEAKVLACGPPNMRAALAERERKARLETYERCRDEAAKNLYNGDEGAEDLRQLFAKWIALETPAREKREGEA